jgi:hypothetical protein
MLNRISPILLILLGASSPARAQLANNHGAQFDPAREAKPDVAPLVTVSTTFVQFHSARVENDLMLFKPTLVGLPAPAHARTAELFARSSPKKKEIRFFVPADSADGLEVRRDRDHLLLFRGPQPQGGAIGVGLAMFGAATLLSAHAPRALRVIFDGPVHLGPAIFDGGGMGAGIAGRGL